MHKNHFNKNWLQGHLNDPYVKLAQKEGYRTRAAYKLKEIDEQDKLIVPGQVIVELGSAPGGWSQYISRKLSALNANKDSTKNSAHTQLSNNLLIALDILPMEPIPGVQFIQGDFRQDDVVQRLTEALQGRKFHLVLSDMAPNLSGVASADAARMADLSRLSKNLNNIF